MSSNSNRRRGAPEEEKEVVTVYVLKLRDGCYYVGSTKNMQRRYSEHCCGLGSQWTRQHSPIEIRHQAEGTPYHEDAMVYEYMSRYGPDNVRGGTYSNLTLTSEQRATIERQISHATQRCMHCHREGHFVSDCPSRVRQQRQRRGPQQCSRCGRNGHSDSACFAATHVNGGRLDFVDSEEDSSDDTASICSRCGRSTHDSSRCYAQRDVNGRSLVGQSGTTERRQENMGGQYSPQASHRHDEECDESSVCSRCGRDSHNSSSCYARAGIDGQPLGYDDDSSSGDDYY